jgi:gluconate 2-dehydrogenase gamma chain
MAPEKIDRRSLIHRLVQGGLALTLMPGFAETAWSALEERRAPPPALGAQAGLVATIADQILPRSDTPSATDVGVVPWIDLIIAEYLSDAQRAAFLADLAAIDEFARSTAGAPLSALQAGALAGVMANLDAACGSKNLSPAQRGYVQLKELVIVGYFTSKPVQQDILKVVIVPGQFDGNVPIAPPSSAA